MTLYDISIVFCLFLSGGGSVAVFFSEDESSSNADDAEEEEEESENEIEEEEDPEAPAFVSNVLERPGGTSRSGPGGTRGTTSQQSNHPMHWAFRNQQPASSAQSRSNESSSNIPASATTSGKFRISIELFGM